MVDIERTARHALVEERTEVVLFATELKRLFDTVGLTLGQFCATSQGIIDKGSLSRYLNGKRVPRERWLLDRLFALRVKAGTPLTEEAQGHLVDLQLAALEVAHPHDYKVRRVTDELDIALTARRESERHVNRLETELTGRERRLADLTADNTRMRADWDADRDRLNREIADLTSQLNLAHERRAAAETRCADLEALLDRLQSGAAARLPSASGAESRGSRGPAAIRVMICDNPGPYRDGLKMLLETEGVHVTGVANDFEQLRHLMRKSLPDAVVVSVSTSPAHIDEGIVGTVDLRQRHPNLGVLVLAAFAEAAYAERLVLTGNGVGYLVKDTNNLETILAALHGVVAGEVIMDPHLVQQLLTRSQTQDKISRLTPRQREALMLMAEGLSNSGIARRMHISEKTVDGYITAILARLDLKDTPDSSRRVAAVLTALQASYPSSPQQGAPVRPNPALPA
ncbi:LuxR C-terminal-related transcriptional regulator [Nonomuraea aurantiaca]|uniref:LuxR C-terminal-related transcriptional regulator n=1 Tax=Nonomuraea aurantiaca TaxID=2878562 RepID=UPI001CD9C520|nr:response regulator transcription factor [Nonomuraea aurantiaca]MCA2229303.1 LuxR C-terminal-related transcriptional regulator [Nonomuraea aurantiaca]